MSGPQNVDDLLALLEEALLVCPGEDCQGIIIRKIATVGPKSRRQGLVLRFQNGFNFRITIAQLKKSAK